MRRILPALCTLFLAMTGSVQANPGYYGSNPYQQQTYQDQYQPSYGARSQHPQAGYYPRSHPGQYQYQQPQPVRAATPQQILHQGIDRLKGFLSRGGAPSEQEARAFLDSEISGYFDFAYMAKWAGGQAFAQMSEQEKQQFTTKLKGMFFGALARNLGAYTNPVPRIEIYPPRSNRSSNEVQVRAVVRPRRGYPVRLEFRFYRAPDGWKVFDVKANGNSAVAYYRQHFAAVARRGPAAGKP
jgi:phospholipid transport system substrate-binding protein